MTKETFLLTEQYISFIKEEGIIGIIKIVVLIQQSTGKSYLQ